MVSIDRVANTKCSAPMRSESVTINQSWSFAPMKSRISPNDAQNIARPSSLRDPGVSVYPAIFPPFLKPSGHFYGMYSSQYNKVK